MRFLHIAPLHAAPAGRVVPAADAALATAASAAPDARAAPATGAVLAPAAGAAPAPATGAVSSPRCCPSCRRCARFPTDAAQI